MSRVLTLALLCVACLSVVSDGYETKRRKRYKCDEQIAKALTKYEKRRFNETKTILTEVKYQCSGNEAMDTVLYYLAMSLVHLKSPLEAKVEFERLSIDFANSAFTEEAQFRIGHCSYLESNPSQRDQSKTKDAIRELSEFVDRYPQSQFVDSANTYMGKCLEKLADKELDAARFYVRIDRHESAIVYYRNFIQTYPQSKNIPEAKLSLASSLVRVSRPAEALEALDDLLSGEIADDVRRKATSLRSKAEEMRGEQETPVETEPAPEEMQPVPEVKELPKDDAPQAEPEAKETVESQEAVDKEPATDNAQEDKDTQEAPATPEE